MGSIWLSTAASRLSEIAPDRRKSLIRGTTAFSLLVLTEQPVRTWLFLKKSHTSPRFPVQSRRENALAFSLLVLTEQSVRTWLFLKKSHTSPRFPVQSRRENALACPWWNGFCTERSARDIQ